jgi:hypothetical protein
MKVIDKDYVCTKCGYKKRIATNHYGKCYSLGGYNACPSCPPDQEPTVWQCAETVPEGGWVPEDWKLVTFGRVAKVKQRS